MQSCYECIDYAKSLNLTLSKCFIDDVSLLMNKSLEMEERKFIKSKIKKYIHHIWTMDKSKYQEINKNSSYLFANSIKKLSKKANFKKLNRSLVDYNPQMTDGRELMKKRLLKYVINIDLVKTEVKNRCYDCRNFNEVYELISYVLYDGITDNGIKVMLYDSSHKSLRNIIVKEIRHSIKDLTKHDKEIDTSTLSETALKQAINTSITKFIETYYQQPKELKTVLIPYENTPLSDYTEITEAMTKDNKEFQLLNKIFKEHKQDTKGRIYNYSLFAFLYYAYGMYISFEHLYNSELLRLLGAYTFRKDRDKPLLKPNHKNLLQQHKEACILSQYDVNIYLENFISFIQQADTKHKNRYVLSYLVDLSHELTASKEYINRLKGTHYDFNNVTYQDLPQPIKTLLLPIKTLQSA